MHLASFPQLCFSCRWEGESLQRKINAVRLLYFHDFIVVVWNEQTNIRRQAIKEKDTSGLPRPLPALDQPASENINCRVRLFSSDVLYQLTRFLRFVMYTVDLFLYILSMSHSGHSPLPQHPPFRQLFSDNVQLHEEIISIFIRQDTWEGNPSWREWRYGM